MNYRFGRKIIYWLYFFTVETFSFRESVSDALINGFSHKNLEGLEPNLILKPFLRTSFFILN